MEERIVIRGGTVVDGSGSPGIRADVAVQAGHIESIGFVESMAGDRGLDATDCVVAPGFIDIHTHYDAQVCWDPQLTPSSFHGVTTVVFGNCGFSIAPTRPGDQDLIVETLKNVEDMSPETLRAGVTWEFETFPEYLEFVEHAGIGLNVGVYIGHTPLRLFVMGDDAFERVATDDEIAAMQSLLREGLQHGAMGFSTSFAPSHQGPGGRPIPSRIADRREVLALLEVVNEERRGVVSVVPGGDFPPEALYELQKVAGVPLTFGAILARPNGSHRDQLELNRAGRLAGADVWPQVTSRSAHFLVEHAESFHAESESRVRRIDGHHDRGPEIWLQRPGMARACRYWEQRPDRASPTVGHLCGAGVLIAARRPGSHHRRRRRGAGDPPGARPGRSGPG